VNELFAGPGFRAIEMEAADITRLAAFYAANPEYHRIVAGGPATPTEAQEDFVAPLPEGWAFTRKWPVLFEDESGEVVGMATLVQDLFAQGVWNVGLFIAATVLHGSGRPRSMYQELEAWMARQGARWLRLGVVQGNARAIAFWERMGYHRVRTREGYRIGLLEHRLHVMVKPLGEADWEAYRRAVPRDDPGT
jgi:RimJ/RimL family protein N-acetyltransferase